MKKLIILITITVFSQFAIFGQETPKLLPGEVHKHGLNKTVKKILLNANSEISVLMTKGRNYWVDRFNNDLELIDSISVIVPKSGKKYCQFESVEYINNELILFTSFLDKKSRKLDIYYSRIRKNQVEENKILISFDVKQFKGNEIQIIKSEDRSKFLVYRNNNMNKYENEEFDLIVFNNKFDLLWSKQITLPYKELYASFEKVFLDNIGGVHAQLVKKPNRAKGEKISTVFQSDMFKFITYNPTKDKLTEYDVNITDQWVDNYTFFVDEEINEIKIVGYYGDSRNKINKLFFNTLSSTDHNIISKSVLEFNDSLISKFCKDDPSEGKSSLKHYKLDHILKGKNKSWYIVGQEEFITKVPSVGPYASLSLDKRYIRGCFNYNNIMVIKLNPEGKLVWAEKIPKRSFNITGINYLSYLLNYNRDKDQICVVFNDYKKNIEKLADGSQRPFVLEDMSLAEVVSVEIENDGRQKRKRIFSYDDRLFLKPLMFLRGVNNDALSIGINNLSKQHRLFRVIF